MRAPLRRLGRPGVARPVYGLPLRGLEAMSQGCGNPWVLAAIYIGAYFASVFVGVWIIDRLPYRKR